MCYKINFVGGIEVHFKILKTWMPRMYRIGARPTLMQLLGARINLPVKLRSVQFAKQVLYSD